MGSEIQPGMTDRLTASDIRNLAKTFREIEERSTCAFCSTKGKDCKWIDGYQWHIKICDACSNDRPWRIDISDLFTHLREE